MVFHLDVKSEIGFCAGDPNAGCQLGVRGEEDEDGAEEKEGLMIPESERTGGENRGRGFDEPMFSFDCGVPSGLKERYPGVDGVPPGVIWV